MLGKSSNRSLDSKVLLKSCRQQLNARLPVRVQISKFKIQNYKNKGTGMFNPFPKVGQLYSMKCSVIKCDVLLNSEVW